MLKTTIALVASTLLVASPAAFAKSGTTLAGGANRPSAHTSMSRTSKTSRTSKMSVNHDRRSSLGVPLHVAQSDSGNSGSGNTGGGSQNNSAGGGSRNGDHGN